MNLQRLIDKGVISLSVKDGRSHVKTIESNWFDFTDVRTLLGLGFDVVDIPDGVYEISKFEEVEQTFNHTTRTWDNVCLDLDEIDTRVILRLKSS